MNIPPRTSLRPLLLGSYMIPYSRCIFSVSTHSLDDVPSGLEHAIAQDYLTGWTSTWDPRLLAAFQSVPEWRRGDTSGLDLEDAVIVVPELVNSGLDQPLEERLRLGRNAIVRTARRPRQQVVHDVLEALRLRDQELTAQSEGHDRPTDHWLGMSDSECILLGDFYAFGYMVMQIQCMARKLRYSFNLDWLKVGEQIRSAATASVSGDADATERWLSAAFDSLSQERDRYCSQQGNLLELVLTASTTLGPNLTAQLQVDRPLTLYASTNTLRHMQSGNASAWGQLRQRARENSIALAGGLRDEQLHGYLTEMALVRELQAAVEDLRDMGLERPSTWMRFQPSLPATVPNIVRKFGFLGGVIAPLGGGTVPTKDHAKVRWQAHGDSLGLDCILGHILDASNSDSMLRLGTEMAKQLDYHQVPTLILAHWPSRTCEAFEDLVAAMLRTPALGKWINANQYFATTAQPYWTDNYGAHEFLVPLPTTPVELHQLHNRLIDYVRRAYRLEQLESLQRLWQWVPRRSRLQGTPMQLEQWQAKVRMFQQTIAEEVVIDGQGTDHTLAAEEGGSLDSDIEALSRELLSDLRGRVQADAEDLVFNPCSHPQRLFLASHPGRIDPTSSTRIVAHETLGDWSQAILDVPSFGFAKFHAARQPASAASEAQASEPSAREQVPKASWLGRVFGGRSAIAQGDGSLANEFMELQIDPLKGHLRSMYVVNKRGNRLSGQVQLVPMPLDLRGRLNESSFLNLQDVRVRVVHASKVRGTIEVEGRMNVVSNSGPSHAGAFETPSSEARCTIRYTLWHGARWLDVEVVGDGMDWHRCYPVWRMVWPSEAASIAAWQNGARGKLPAPLQGTVELIEIDDVEHRIHFATHGLSMHRRLGGNGLVTVLPMRATGNVSARFSIGMDWPRPWEMAIDRMQEPFVARADGHNNRLSNSPPDAGAWLAQCNASNLRFSWIDPSPSLQVSPLEPVSPQESEAQSVQDGTDSADETETLTADACLWIVETIGKAGTARLGCVRQIARAWRVDFRGLEYDRLKVEDGELVFPFQAWERSRIAICFKD